MAKVLLRAFSAGRFVGRWRCYTTRAHTGVPSKTPQWGDNQMIDLYKFHPAKFSDVEEAIRSNATIQKEKRRLARMHVRGRCLEVTFCKEANISKQDLLITSAIKEDGNPRPVSLVISNVVLPSTSTDEARMWYPKGVRVKIKHPFASILPTGGLVVEVQNPLYIEYVGAELPSGCTTVDDTFEEAHRALEQKDFIRAVALYTRCLEDDEFADRLEAFQSRAEAWHGAGYHEAAMHDLSNASYLSGHNLRNLMLRGHVSFALGDYRVAMACFGNASAEDSILKRCAALVEQEDRRDYNFTDHYLDPQDKNLPELSNYLGPVEFKMTTDGRGRGVFATEDVKAGNILAVWNAAAVAAELSELKTKLVHAVMRSRRTLWQCLSLWSSSVAEIDLFTPQVTYKHDPDAVLWFETLSAVDKLCSRYPFQITTEEDNKKFAVWTLPVLFNHSCVPNVSQQILGTVAVLRAARDISRGDELCMTYTDVKAPVHARRSRTNKEWGFSCDCVRCKEEAKLVKAKPALVLLAQEMEAAVEALLGKAANEAMYKLSRIACDVEKHVQRMANEDQKKWLRTSFIMAYMILAENADYFRSSMELPPLTPVKLMEALHSTSPGCGVMDEMLTLASMDPSQDYDVKKELIIQEFVSFYGKDVTEEARDTLIGNMLEQQQLEFQF